MDEDIGNLVKASTSTNIAVQSIMSVFKHSEATRYQDSCIAVETVEEHLKVVLASMGLGAVLVVVSALEVPTYAPASFKLCQSSPKHMRVLLRDLYERLTP